MTDPTQKMADDLEALGLYATGKDVRAGRADVEKALSHVRDYCLARTLKAIKKREGLNRESPPIPGTWGARALPQLIERRDQLQAFLDRWEASHA